MKEKFGGLRVYVNHANDAIRGRLEVARQESVYICEVAGNRENGGRVVWIKTLCDEHASALKAAQDRSGMG